MAHTCDECKDPSHRLLKKQHFGLLPEGTTGLGEVACFDKNLIKEYFYAGEKEFKPCRENCKRCTNGEDCQECGNQDDPSKKLYLLDENGKSSCVESCNLNDHRFEIKIENEPVKCLQCSKEKPHLIKNPSGPECIACVANGFYLSQKSKTCKACGTNCVKCDSDGQCLGCLDANMAIQISGENCDYNCGVEEKKDELASPKRCTNCVVENCQKCNPTGLCTECNKGFYKIIDVNSLASCAQCESTCEECDTVNSCNLCKDKDHFIASDGSKCIEKCPEGEFEVMNNGVKMCNKCSLENCLECSDDSSCSKCAERFFLSESGKECKSCPRSCSKCRSESLCESCVNENEYLQTDKSGCLPQCNKGEYGDAKENKCYKCPEKCPSCSSSTSCDTCEKGMMSDGNGGCESCPENCQDCQHSGCMKCTEGYFVDGKVCSECQNNCLTCESGTICKQCKKDLNFVSGQGCVACSSGCLDCQHDGCKKCSDGYYLNGRVCSKCQKDCKRCDSGVICQECEKNLKFVNGEGCVSCSEGCLDCQLDGCKKCSDPYYLASNGCSKCQQDNCLECERLERQLPPM